ncbi:MAG TPA: hypothetical protein VL171_06675 [Verrucomicrobiae bacterium]|nr:hypothetical protein [Verrucomicrobiae bacterium]
MRILIALSLAAVLTGCATVSPTAGPGRPFDFRRDTFAFHNELVFKSSDPSSVSGVATTLQKLEHPYTRRCFIMAAGVVQFWKHARFDPSAPPVAESELARRIREVRDDAAWWPGEPPTKRVVFPGFAGLRDLSQREGRLLRANMGAGWTTYFHLRKFPMPFVPSRTHQARLCQEVRAWLRSGHPMVLWLYNFPDVNINHAVTVFEEIAPPNPDQIAFHVYDPNYTDAPRTLIFDRATSAFYYEKTFYFPGGLVHARQMFTSLLR